MKLNRKMNAKKLFILNELLLILTMVFGISQLSFAAGTSGSITGMIHVKRAYVNTKGPRSNRAVVVYLLPVHPPKFLEPKATAVMIQKKLNFFPHVLIIQKGSTVKFLNDDTVKHDVMDPGDFDLGIFGKGVARDHTFKSDGTKTILCSLHPQMLAYIIVVNTPYFTKSDLITNYKLKQQYAKYLIGNIPAGNYVVRVWNHDLSARRQHVHIVSGKTTVLNINIHE